MNMKLLIGLIVIFGSLQLVPVDRNYPPVISDISAPAAVSAVLRRSCYDCHSSETRWRWYGLIAPMSWVVARDVNRGREALNFSNWNPLNSRKNKAKIYEAVHAGKMPSPLYALAHPSARLTPPDLELLQVWSAVTTAPSARSPITALKILPDFNAVSSALWSEPIVIQFKENATQYFSPAALLQLDSLVDFGRQQLLLFGWQGSGHDQLNYEQTELNSGHIYFSLKKGMTRDLRQHTKAFVVNSNVSWSVLGE
jgi:hypothetical protein